jgi:hypothetical protein
MAHNKFDHDPRISQTVRRQTGKSSEQWHTLLDRWDWRHTDSTKAEQHLQRRYGLSVWSARTILLRYQMQRRLRQ